MDIEKISTYLRNFAKKRNWEQFHTPKNLSMALSVEVAELVEIFQWLTEKQSIDIRKNEKELAFIREEIADILIYLIRLADILNIDIEQAILDKISLNEQKYPEDLSKDNAIKYNKR